MLCCRRDTAAPETVINGGPWSDRVKLCSWLEEELLLLLLGTALSASRQSFDCRLKVATKPDLSLSLLPSDIELSVLN